MLSGVRPIIRLASWPTARISPVVAFSATTRRLVEQDAAAADVDQRVGGAEVDRHVTADDAVRHARCPRRFASYSGKSGAHACAPVGRRNAHADPLAG